MSLLWSGATFLALQGYRVGVDVSSCKELGGCLVMEYGEKAACSSPRSPPPGCFLLNPKSSWWSSWSGSLPNDDENFSWFDILEESMVDSSSIERSWSCIPLEEEAFAYCRLKSAGSSAIEKWSTAPPRGPLSTMIIVGATMMTAFRAKRCRDGSLLRAKCWYSMRPRRYVSQVLLFGIKKARNNKQYPIFLIGVEAGRLQLQA